MDLITKNNLETRSYLSSTQQLPTPAMLFVIHSSVSIETAWATIVRNIATHLACEQAPEGASAGQYRSLHAFSQITNVCVQNLDAKRWLVDCNYSWCNLSFQFRYRQKLKWRKGEKKFFKRLPRIYPAIWSLSCNWSPNSVMKWSIYSTTMMRSPFFLHDIA